MAIYEDRGNLNVSSSKESAAQLAESPYVYETVPSLQSYLASYPHGALPAGAAEIVFWSEDVLPRLRPILSVTHLIVYTPPRSEEHTSELQSRLHLVCRLLLEKKKKTLHLQT